MAGHLRQALTAFAVALVVVGVCVDVSVSGAAASPGRVTPGAAYVALGDSYASGEGSFAYLSGTDVSSNHCHQATNGYVEQLATKLNMVDSLAFDACSGAVIDDLYKTNNGVWAEEDPPTGTANDVPAQLPGHLGPGTQIVTLSIGGNSVGFVPLISDCVYNKNAASFGATGQPNCQQRDAAAAATNLGYLASGRPAGCIPYYPNAQSGNRQGFCDAEPSLTQVYQRIASLAPNAAIYVMTYPHLFTPPAHKGNCKVGSAVGGTNTYVIATSDAQWLNSEVDALNSVIRTAAAAASTATRTVHVIDPPTTFSDHGVCSNKPWINGALVSGTSVEQESFHPNTTGQNQWYATLAAAAIPATIPPPTITSTTVPAGVVGTPYSQSLTTADNRNGTWSLAVLSATDNFPPGLALSGDTITGTPTAAGSYTFGISFTDGAGQTASVSEQIAIARTTSPAHGVVWAWGTDQAGQLGDGGGTYAVSSPQLVPGVTDVVMVQSGQGTAYALLGDGTVVSWGVGAFGARGNSSSATTPAPVTGLDNVIAVAGGYNSGYALTADGTVWCWGYGRQGQLGNGADANSTTPVQASGLTDVTSIAVGEYTAYALRADGTVWAWGSGTGGQLGNGDTVNSTTPVQVDGLTGIKSIGAGYSSGYAVDAGGTAYGWGVGSSGELGPAAGLINPTPVQIADLPPVTTVTGGFATGFALTAGGETWSWGTGRSGQLTPSPTPTPVVIPGGATSVSAEADTTFVVTSDGVWAWGAGSFGQLGNGSTTVTSTTPVRVNTPPGVTQVAAGESDGYALAPPQQ